MIAWEIFDLPHEFSIETPVQNFLLLHLQSLNLWRELGYFNVTLTLILLQSYDFLKHFSVNCVTLLLVCSTIPHILSSHLIILAWLWKLLPDILTPGGSLVRGEQGRLALPPSSSSSCLRQSLSAPWTCCSFVTLSTRSLMWWPAMSPMWAPTSPLASLWSQPRGARVQATRTRGQTRAWCRASTGSSSGSRSGSRLSPHWGQVKLGSSLSLLNGHEVRWSDTWATVMISWHPCAACTHLREQEIIWFPHLGTCSPDGQLLDLPPRHGVREDVVRGEGGVVIGTGPPLTQPGHDAGATEPYGRCTLYLVIPLPHSPVTTGCLVRVPLTQEADGALQPGGQGLHKLEVIPPLVIMSPLWHRDSHLRMSHSDLNITVSTCPLSPAWCLPGHGSGETLSRKA